MNKRNYENKIIILINITQKFRRSIDIESLLFLDSSSNYTCLTFKNGLKKMYSYHLKIFEKDVLPNHFIRINRSKLVNINFIQKSLKNGDSLYFVLQDNTKVLIPRKRRKELKLKFPQLFN